MTQQLSPILITAIMILAPVVMALLGRYILKLHAYTDAKVKNVTLRGILDRLEDVAYLAVVEVEQTFVSKLTPASPVDSMAKAKDSALAIMKTHMGQRGLDEAKQVLGLSDQDLEKVLVSYLEAKVAAHTNTPPVVFQPAAPPSDPAVPVPVDEKAPDAPKATDAPADEKSPEWKPSVVGSFLPLLFVSLMGMLNAGCYCWQAAHVNEPKCVVVHQEIDCVEKAISGQALGLLPEIAQMASQGALNWGVIGQRLIAMGINDGGCTLAFLAADFLQKSASGAKSASASYPQAPQSIDATFQTWKKSQGIEGVSFKVKTGSGVVVIK